MQSFNFAISGHKRRSIPHSIFTLFGHIQAVLVLPWIICGGSRSEIVGRYAGRWLWFPLVLACPCLATATESAPSSCRELRRFDAPEATQAVAVDEAHFYAIGNRVIAKYDKQSGRRVIRWTASGELSLRHLNSGVVRDGRLYCAHSNFPQYPEASSIEIWDGDSLEHIGNHSLGIYEGSLTWIDWHEGAWWAVFAHYTEKVNGNPHAHDARWTSLVQFDRKWRRTAGWTFPPQVIERFQPHSCSGGSWGDDGLLYVTGHDRGELYRLAIPQAGATLALIDTIAVPFTGQGFAFDPSHRGALYGIDRPKKQVVVVEFDAANSQHRTTKRIPPRSRGQVGS